METPKFNGVFRESEVFAKAEYTSYIATTNTPLKDAYIKLLSSEIISSGIAHQFDHTCVEKI